MENMREASGPIIPLRAMVGRGVTGSRPYVDRVGLEQRSLDGSTLAERRHKLKWDRATKIRVVQTIAVVAGLAFLIYALVHVESRHAIVVNDGQHSTILLAGTPKPRLPVKPVSAESIRGSSRATSFSGGIRAGSHGTSFGRGFANKDIAHANIEARDPKHKKMGVEIPDWAMRLCTDVPPFKPWFCFPTPENYEEMMDVPEWAIKTCDLPPMEPFWCSSWRSEEAGELLRLMPILNECGDSAVFHDSAYCHKPGGKRDIGQAIAGVFGKQSASTVLSEGPIICAPGVKGCEWDGAYGVRTQVRDIEDSSSESEVISPIDGRKKAVEL